MGGRGTLHRGRTWPHGRGTVEALGCPTPGGHSPLRPSALSRCRGEPASAPAGPRRPGSLQQGNTRLPRSRRGPWTGRLPSPSRGARRDRGGQKPRDGRVKRKAALGRAKAHEPMSQGWARLSWRDLGRGRGQSLSLSHSHS